MSTFTRSVTPSTPVGPGRPPQTHHTVQSVTWVNDWYNPTEDFGSVDFANIKLKGWYRDDSIPKKDNSFNPNDVLDLAQWKYYKEVPLVEHNIVKNETPVAGASSQLGKGVTFADGTNFNENNGDTAIIADNAGGEEPSTIQPNGSVEVTKELDSEKLSNAIKINPDEGEMASLSEAGLEPESQFTSLFTFKYTGNLIIRVINAIS
ncbi:hypothetical protein QCA50_017402 [Cerrena zonata]|uniref:Uncharacterized protein n=1 Tax=Cerrena zonata TaxID=2478898 RepID=A0AAW0FQB6_9APHY